MKKICAVLLLSACSTTPGTKPEENLAPPEVSRITVIGSETAQIKSPSVADLTQDDWKQSKASCITHLYECQYNSKGQITQLKALDQSEPTFQSLTEEALRAWSFQEGKSGTCYAQMIYERDLPTRVLVVPQDMAQSMVSNLQRNRAVLPKAEPGKSFPTSVKKSKIEAPREMLLKGQSGYIVVNFDIDPEGAPINLKVVDEEPAGMLEKSALRAIKQWRYATLADEPNSLRNSTATITVQSAGSSQVTSSCDVGLKLNRLAQAQLSSLQENTTGPRQAPNPSLK